MIEALIEARGIVTSACNATQIPRATYYWWVNHDADFKAAVNDVQEIAIDFVEGKLYDKISGGDTIATIFYLKTRAKHRGYVEKQEIVAPDGIFVVMKKAEEAVPSGNASS